MLNELKSHTDPVLLARTVARGRGLTLQEVQLTGGGVQAHEVEPAGRPAPPPLGRRLPGGQTLQHAALPGAVQTQNQNLTLPVLLLLLRAENSETQVLLAKYLQTC